MTWDKEANQREDRLRALWLEGRSQPHGQPDPALAEQLRAAEQELRSLQVLYDEWESLFREKLLVERGLRQEGGLDRAQEGSTGHAPSPDRVAESTPAFRPTRPVRLLPGLAAFLAPVLLERLGLRHG